MPEFYASGRIVDLVLLVIVAEFLIIAAVNGRTGHGIAPHDLWPNLLSATFLLLAVRNTLVDGLWLWTACFLAASFPAHLLDLHRRWNNPRRSRRPASETGIAPSRGDR